MMFGIYDHDPYCQPKQDKCAVIQPPPPKCKRGCLRRPIRSFAHGVKNDPGRLACPECWTWLDEDSPSVRTIEPFANSYLDGVRTAHFSCVKCDATNTVRMP